MASNEALRRLHEASISLQWASIWLLFGFDSASIWLGFFLDSRLPLGFCAASMKLLCIRFLLGFNQAFFLLRFCSVAFHSACFFIRLLSVRLLSIRFLSIRLLSIRLLSMMFFSTRFLSLRRRFIYEASSMRLPGGFQEDSNRLPLGFYWASVWLVFGFYLTSNRLLFGFWLASNILPLGFCEVLLSFYVLGFYWACFYPVPIRFFLLSFC